VISVFAVIGVLLLVYVCIWAFRGSVRRRKMWGTWIGRMAYGKREGFIPRWVERAIKRIYRRQMDPHDHTIPGSSLGLLTFSLRGRHFRYRLVFSGQGGPIVDVFRCRRR